MSEKEMPTHHGVEDRITGDYPNETMRILIERASCRSFADKEIPEDVMHLILEAGIHSPTGGNLQPYSIIKIEDEEMRRRLAEMCWQDFMAKAPIHLLFCIDWHRIKRWAELEIAPFAATSAFRHFWISFQDTIICAQNICTAVDAMGLGSVYIGTIMEFVREVKAMLQLPQAVFPVILLCLGYPKGKRHPRKKLGIEVVVHPERYRELDDQELIDAFNDKYEGMRVEITDERLEKISEVCEQVHGPEFAKRCIESIKERGYIKPVQRYFGLHYRADVMPDGNDTFLELMEESGYDWFKKCSFGGG